MLGVWYASFSTATYQEAHSGEPFEDCWGACPCVLLPVLRLSLLPGHKPQRRMEHRDVEGGDGSDDSIGRLAVLGNQNCVKPVAAAGARRNVFHHSTFRFCGCDCVRASTPRQRPSCSPSSRMGWWNRCLSSTTKRRSSCPMTVRPISRWSSSSHVKLTAGGLRGGSVARFAPERNR
jgi:hypothetical protein